MRERPTGDGVDRGSMTVLVVLVGLALTVALTLALKRDPAVRWHYEPIRFRDRQGGTNSINVPKIFRMGWNMLRALSGVR